MWGHYANAGMGVAIEIEDDNCEKMKEVNYDDDYKNLNTIEEILTHKTEEWEYEKEFRCLVQDTNTDGITRKIGTITKIHFGTPYEKLEPENYKEIKKIHTKLRKYLYLKKELEIFCESKNIEFEDY
jgi:hypothetical protein